MSYGTIKTYVRDVTHRTDLSDDLFDNWNAAVAAQLNNDLLLNDLIFTTTVTTSNNGFYVDINSGEILEVSAFADDGTKYPLVATTFQQVRTYELLTGPPVFYCMKGDTIVIAPFSSGIDIQATYREFISKFSGDTDTNTVFNTRPQVYYYAFLTFAYEYSKDFESADRYKQLYQAEVDRINRREAFIDAGAANQMQGASQWV